MKKYHGYLLTAAIVASLLILGQFADDIFILFEHNPAEASLLSTFFIVSMLFVLSTAVFYLSETTKLPPFIFGIIIGISAHPFLQPILAQDTALSVIVGLGATLILFGGGLETQFQNFRRLFWKIMLLGFPGLLLTALLFSLSTFALGNGLDQPISLGVAVLLGAILASTDPAAIIPILRRLRFKNNDVKDIIVSESAVTDVSGTLVTVVFLALMAAGVTYASIPEWYGALFSRTSALNISTQLLFGVAFGVLGYIFLELLQRFKRRHGREFEADSAFFLFIPIVIFTFALSFGGSGYLAAFIAGLLFSLKEHLHETERFFNHIIDGFFKPTIFILLGALVNPTELMEYFWIGLAAAALFMLVIRPLVVYLMLGWSTLGNKPALTWRDLLFISAVRETGAIPAVLLVTVISLGLNGLDGLVAIGMWVIVLTLAIQPAITPWLARKLSVGEPMVDVQPIELGASPLAILVTRGHSFIDRLPIVANWAKQHHVQRITVLLCLEKKYSPALEAEIKRLAEQAFAKLDPEFDCTFISRQGLLQDNIKAFGDQDHSVTTVFVGRKMLDYRLPDIKRLRLPFYFMD